MVPMHWNADDVEDVRRYTTGGFHPVSLGDVMTADSPPRQYRIVHKLGRGAYSTVWLAETLHLPSKRYVALKICIADANSQHEVKIFGLLPLDESRNVLRLLDSFSIQGPNGLHTILVHDVLGSPTTLMRSATRSGHRVLCRQLAQGLAALHRHGIVHGDLHFGNIGVALPTLNDHTMEDILDYFGHPECTIVLPHRQPSHPKALPAYLLQPISIAEYLTQKDPTLEEGPLRAEIMDLGNALLAEEPPRPFCTPPAFCAPELLFGLLAHSIKSPSTHASDIWSFACTIYELVFGPSLFHFSRPNERLLGRMAILCGEIPPSWKSYWESKEQLRSLTISHEAADAEWQILLEHFTTTKQLGGTPTKADVSGLFDLLRFMLNIDPGCRPSAQEVLQHPWFARGDGLGEAADLKRVVTRKGPPETSSFKEIVELTQVQELCKNSNTIDYHRRGGQTMGESPWEILVTP